MSGVCTKKPGYFARLLAALLGRQPAPTAPTAAEQEVDYLQLQSRVAGLEMELRERDERIAEMQAEYKRLAAARDQAEAAGAESELEKVFKRLAAPLSNLAAMASFAESGEQVEAGDLLSLIASLQQELGRAGLEPIGRVGEKVPFDVATHQRMSGQAVAAGTPVTIELPGFRLGEKILLKAMVSAHEDTLRQEGDDGESGD